MKRQNVILLAVFVMFTMLACEFAGINIDLGGGKEEHDQVATIEAGIDSPPNGANLKMAPVDVAYHASSLDGISAVELSIDGEVVNSFSSPASDQKVIALKYAWQPTEAGSYTIRVRAQSSTGLWSDFVASNVNIEGQAQEQVEPTAQPPLVTPQQPAQTAQPAQPTATPKEFTFFDIKHDRDKFYYGGSGCGSREITITTRVTHPEKVFAAYLFTRFYDKEGDGVSVWDAGHSMKKINNDTYSVTLQSNKISNYNMFEYTIMNYQIVVQDKVNSILARSEVVKKVTLEICP
jgi:hypothetical protein